MRKAKAKKKTATRKPAAPKSSGTGFVDGQRVTVTAPGSFAARQCGKVTRVAGGKVFVMLDHKQAEKEFPAGDLAPA